MPNVPRNSCLFKHPAVNLSTRAPPSSAVCLLACSGSEQEPGLKLCQILLEHDPGPPSFVTIKHFAIVYDMSYYVTCFFFYFPPKILRKKNHLFAFWMYFESIFKKRQRECFCHTVMPKA